MSTRSDDEEQALEQATAWHQALARDDADWDAYTAWLEADPLHRRLFDEIAVLDRIVDERSGDLRVLATARPTDDGLTWRLPRRWWLGGAAAAALAGVVAVPLLRSSPEDLVYATAAGETRRLALGAGEQVELAPSSRLIAVGGDRTKLLLAGGEAFFTVAHDPDRNLSVGAGGYTVTDIGTRFGINLAADCVTVSVAEGSLVVAQDGGAARQIGAGQRLFGRAGGSLEVSRVASSDVGSWRRGRLVYDRTPLRVVADDLARYSGRKVTVDPLVGERRFSGVLNIGDGSRLVQNLADLMAISYRAEGDGVRLVAGPPR